MKRGSFGCLLLLMAWVAAGSQCPTTAVPISALTGDAANGRALYTDNVCGACHCADATGGCAANAPSLIGVTTQVLDDDLRGSSVHAGGKYLLTDQEIADLQAFLANPSM